MSALQPRLGVVTFESEGAEHGPYHSRKLHVPSSTSGLTLGRGYDMKLKSSSKIFHDLLAAGLAESDAALLSKAAGLSGQSAKAFIAANHLEAFEISQQAQVELFNISYGEEESETKRLCTKPDVEAKYGKCDWSRLDPAIRQVLVDLKFRGDYTGTTRRLIQRAVVANDTREFLRVLSDRNAWSSLRVPPDRFQRRIEFFQGHAAL